MPYTSCATTDLKQASHVLTSSEAASLQSGEILTVTGMLILFLKWTAPHRNRRIFITSYISSFNTIAGYSLRICAYNNILNRCLLLLISN